MADWIWIAVVVAAVLIVVAVGLTFRSRPRLRPLSPESRARYASAWREIQARFVEQPREAVGEADKLALAILQERGAPLDDGHRFPGEITRARELVRAAAGSGEGRAEGDVIGPDRGPARSGSTEGLRRAMVHYQSIVDDAVGSRRPHTANSEG